MILDTSAIVAILFKEPEAADFLRMISDTSACSLSAATYVEATMVIEKTTKPGGVSRLDALLREGGIIILPFTVEQAHIARQAFLDYGKGRHPAGLNLGDCFAYALAKASGEPLLFKGADFAQTDVVAAL